MELTQSQNEVRNLNSLLQQCNNEISRLQTAVSNAENLIQQLNQSFKLQSEQQQTLQKLYDPFCSPFTLPFYQQLQT